MVLGLGLVGCSEPQERLFVEGARQELEAILGAKVYLDLHVAVHERWREDERFLGELDWPLGE